ncbi:hypothetical protein YC2023_083971 [Brassica napus]
MNRRKICESKLSRGEGGPPETLCESYLVQSPKTLSDINGNASDTKNGQIANPMIVFFDNSGIIVLGNIERQEEFL